MTKYRRKITKEQYERAMLNNGIITDEDMKEIFSTSEMYGYGVYTPKAIEDHEEYYVTFTLGIGCD